MKISKQTLDILKNFATINENILIKEGNVLTTRTVAKNIFVKATVNTEFPQDFGIYNLTQLLGVLTLFSDPDIELSEKSLTIAQGKNTVQYRYAAPDVLDYPEKEATMPSVDASFELSEENLKSILRAGSILKSTDLNISGDGDKIVCTVLDPKNNAANTFSVEVGTTDRNFSVFIKLENMKMIVGKYNVQLSEKKRALFSSPESGYEFFIANEKNSTWESQ